LACHSLRNQAVGSLDRRSQRDIAREALGMFYSTPKTVCLRYLHPTHPLIARHLGQFIGNLFGELDVVV
jgi:hypothetical protein